jgi:hypothetical protein
MLQLLIRSCFVVVGVLLTAAGAQAQTDDPPPINPFGPAKTTIEDAVPGYLELSNGKVHPGQVFLTRDVKLIVLDNKSGAHREIPLRVIQRMDCKILKEWQEKEWRFKESANDEKVYTGRSYPVREYEHVITLNGGRQIVGGVSGIVYVQGKKKERFLLHKRQKGDVGAGLGSLIYVRAIRLGESAPQEGQQKAAKKR